MKQTLEEWQWKIGWQKNQLLARESSFKYRTIQILFMWYKEIMDSLYNG